MRRLAALQAQQKRLAEWTLAATVGRQAALAEAQRTLAEFVDGGDLVGRLAGEALAQAQRLARRSQQVEEQQRVHAAAVREADRRLKTTERAGERLAVEARATAERQSLADLLDGLAGRRPEVDR